MWPDIKIELKMTLGCHRLRGVQKSGTRYLGDPVQQLSHGGVRILHSQLLRHRSGQGHHQAGFVKFAGFPGGMPGQ